MPYGGPRFEFFTQNQFDNHTAFIRKEDATRAAAIRQRRDAADEAEFQQTRLATQRAMEAAAQVQREVAAEAEAAALRQRRLAAEGQAAKRQRQRDRTVRGQTRSCVMGNSPTRSTVRAGGAANCSFAGSARLLALSQPKVPTEEPAGGALTYGCCMHQRGETVVFPVGRNGQPYTPGVDRDRIIPARPDLSVKPWEGSYSTQHQHRDASAASRPAALHACTASVNGEGIRTHAGGTARASLHDDADSDNAVARQPRDTFAGSSSGCASPTAAPSVFSHGSSDGPIEATGTLHMVAEPRAGRAQVVAHLSQRKASNASHGDGRHRGTVATGSLAALTLPELSYRVVATQAR